MSVDCGTLHKASFSNKRHSAHSVLAGCFQCLRTFPSVEARWLREKGGKDDTAVCPHCGVDSVLFDTQCSLSGDVLKQMFAWAFRQTPA